MYIKFNFITAYVLKIYEKNGSFMLNQSAAIVPHFGAQMQSFWGLVAPFQ